MAGLEGLLIGRTLAGRYQIEDVVGRGGMAAVFRARDEVLRRTVAVKVITVSGRDDDERDRSRGRFEREAQSLARLQHRNVVTVFDFGTDAELGIDFLVMELLQGEDLASRLRGSGSIPREVALRIVTEAADGIAAGHQAGLIHRDVKPGNLFLTEGGGDGSMRVVVLDFGIARIVAGDEPLTSLTRGHSPLSPAYASPEQISGVPSVSPASDVYSLAVVAYELLTGSRPHPGEGPPRSATSAPPILGRDPSVPSAIAEVVDRALRFEPGARYTDASAFCDAWRKAVLSAGAAESLPPVVVPEAPAGDPVPPLDGGALSRASSDSSPSDSRVESASPEPPVRPRFPEASRQISTVDTLPQGVSGAARGGPRGGKSVAWIVAALLILVAIGVWAMSRGGDGADPDTVALGPSAEGERVDDDGAAPSAEQVAGGVDPAESDGASSASGETGSGRQPGAGGPPVVSAPAAGVQGAGGGDALSANRDGLRLIEGGQVAAAVGRFRRAVELAPGNAHYRNNLGWALYRAGQMEDARRELDRVVSIDPARDIAYANLGEVHLAQGDTAGAISAYERFLELNSDPTRERIAGEKLARIRGER